MVSAVDFNTKIKLFLLSFIKISFLFFNAQMKSKISFIDLLDNNT